MKCPHCDRALTDEQAKSLWGSRNAGRRKTKAGGRNAPGWPKGKPRQVQRREVVAFQKAICWPDGTLDTDGL